MQFVAIGNIDQRTATAAAAAAILPVALIGLSGKCLQSGHAPTPPH